jgi:hypothetical protein
MCLNYRHQKCADVTKSVTKWMSNRRFVLRDTHKFCTVTNKCKLFHKLSQWKKLDALQKHKSCNENNKETTKHTYQTRLIKLTQVKCSNDQINTLNLGFYCAREKNHKQFTNTLIIYIVRVIKSRKLRWAGHVARMGEVVRRVNGFGGETWGKETIGETQA